MRFNREIRACFLGLSHNRYSWREKLSFSWIIPVSSNEGRSVVERCLTATIRIVEPGDEIIVICSDRVRPLVEEIVKPVLGKIALNIVRHPPTRTPGAARNAGIRQAKFDQLIFQDIDDVPHKNRRKLCEANLTKPKSIFTGGYNVVYDGAEIGKRSRRRDAFVFAQICFCRLRPFTSIRNDFLEKI